MVEAKVGDTVKVHYTGSLIDGTEFDTSKNREPMEFKIGAEQVVPGFEQIVIGMQPGETKASTVACDDAYGPRDDKRVLDVDRKSLPPDVEIEVGQVLEMCHEDGARIPVMVADVGDDKVTLDANHPLAGKDLTFEIELLEIV